MGLSLKNGVWTMDSSPSATSIDLTPAATVSYTIDSPATPLDRPDWLVGAGGIVDGWQVPPYADGMPTVTEDATGLYISSSIGANNVRPSYDKQWANTGPGIMLPTRVIGDFDFQVKISSDEAASYQLAGVACWFYNPEATNYSGGIYTCRGYFNATNSKPTASSIGNGCRYATGLTPSPVNPWATGEWLRLKRTSTTITHAHRPTTSDPWTEIEERPWDRSGGTAWLGIALGSNKTYTANIRVERIIATYIKAPGTPPRGT